MSTLQDYLTKKRQEQREDSQSPQKLLEALQANTGKTASLTGEHSEKTSGMMGGIDKLVDEARSQMQIASTSAKDLKIIREVGTTSNKIINKQLIELNKTMRDLLAATNTLVKQTKPPPNSKDDTYAKHRDAAAAAAGKSGKDGKPVGNNKSGGGGSALWDLAAGAYDVYDAWRDGKNAKNGPQGEQAAKPKGKGLRLRGRARLAGRQLNGIGKVVAENSSKAWQVLKGANAKGLETVASKTGATGEVVAKTSNVTQNAGKAWEATKGAGSKALEVTKSVGTKALDAAKPVMTTIGENAGKAWQATKGVGSTALEGAKSFGKGAMKLGGRALGSAAVPLTVGMGAYEAYESLNDDTKTSGEKAQGVAKAAGGTAGALAGGAYGASVGATLGSVVPVVGTAIGGIAGGAIGGIGGYFGGGALVDGISGALASAVDKSGLGDTIGAATAVAMSPFSAEAANAVKQNLVPSLVATGDKFQTAAQSVEKSTTETLSAFSRSMTEWTDKFKDGIGTVGNAASSIWAGAKQAVRSTGDAAKSTWQAAKEGYKDGGVSGALKKGGKAAAEGVTGIKDQTLGAVSARFESGKKGVETISTGKGDHGGVSYGTHQLATNNGSMAAFLGSKEGQSVAKHFDGLTPGSEAFNAKYKQVVGTEEGKKAMTEAQHGYMQRTHFEPQAAKLKETLGMDVSKEGRAVQEAVWSTSTQHGAKTDVITKALKGKDLASMSDADKVKAIQDYKAANVDKNFKSSSEGVKDGVRRRIAEEGKVLASIANDPNANKPAGSATPSSVNLAKAESATGQMAQAPEAKATGSKPTLAKAPEITSVRQDPIAKVSPSTPVETKPVQVANAGEIKPDLSSLSQPKSAAQAGGQAQGTVPDLASIPLQINDMGLVLLNIGHI